MLTDHLKLLIGRRWMWWAIPTMLLSYLPLWLMPHLSELAVLLPVVIAAVVFMLVRRLTLSLLFGWWLLNALAGSLALLLAPIDAWGTRPRSLVLILIAQLAVGLVQVLVVRGAWWPGWNQRLRQRIQRQSQRLQAVEQNNELTAQQYESDRRALLEHLPVHIVQKDRQGRFTFVTQSFCQLVNRSFEEVIGCTDQDLFPADAARKFMLDDQRVMEQGIVFDDVEQTQLPNGKHSYMQVRKAALRDAQGQVIGVQGIFWDVTEAHASRRELQRIESLAHALIHAALDAVLIVDGDGRVLEANPASEQILGYTRDQVAAHPSLGSIMHTSVEHSGERSSDTPQADQRYERKVPIATVLKSATDKRIEAKLRRSDGAWFDAEISTHPLAIGGSEGWAMFIRDITKRKLVEHELRSAKELAERANAAKSEFVANVSHELRTPLTGIIGLHDLLARSDIDSRQQNYLQLAQISASNLLNLIDDLLDFSKIEAGRIDIERIPFSLPECVEEAAVAIAARAQLKGLELLVEILPDVPEAMLGDPHRIKQILLNLLGNAIKFTEAGDVRIRVALANPTQSGPSPAPITIRFEVHDCGIGIPQEQRQFIWDAFRQADSSTTRRYGGTGLGLTICRDLVELMHGTIGIADARNLQGLITPGTCFYFELPLEAAEPHSESRPMPAVREDIILVASPCPWRELLEGQLRQLGCPVMTMTAEQLTRREPANLFAAGNRSIVIADFRELNSQRFSAIPVVVRWVLLTPLASSQPNVVPNWLKYADVYWLSRPIRRRQLLEALTLNTGDEERPLKSVEQAPARSVHVLLVEDSPVSQTVLKDMLESLGHRVSLASNGTEAMAACRERLFDLVLMDIQMPEVDGLSATRQIRAQESGDAHQLILALTAHASADDRVRCEEAGMNGFLVKPITLDDLRAAVAGATDVTGEFSLAASATRGSFGNQPTAGSATPPAPPTVEPLEAEPPAIHGFSIQAALAEAPDWSGLVSLMHGNEQLLRDVLQLLVSEVPKQSRSFAKAVAKQDFKEARRAVHTLKSNVRYVGLQQIGEIAEELEHCARDERLDVLQEAVGQLDAIAKAVADWAEQSLQAS